MISDEQLAEWQSLADEATKGPWFACEGRDYSEIHERTATHARALALVGSKHKDAEFIAAAREAVPALIAEVRRLQAQLTKAMDERSDFGTIGYFQGRSDARDVVRRIEREAEWLAEQLEHTTEYCNKSQSIGEHCIKVFEEGECAKCWRQAARDAMEN